MTTRSLTHYSYDSHNNKVYTDFSFSFFLDLGREEFLKGEEYKMLAIYSYEKDVIDLSDESLGDPFTWR